MPGPCAPRLTRREASDLADAVAFASPEDRFDVADALCAAVCAAVAEGRTDDPRGIAREAVRAMQIAMGEEMAVPVN
jgi:hypothetical protein